MGSPTVVGNVLYGLAFLVSVYIRHPRETESAQVKVAVDQKSTLEQVLLALVAVGCCGLPLLYFLTPFLRQFNRLDQDVCTVVLGAAVTLVWLYLFHRSHVDLGRNWSRSLELREDHKLVTRGVYAYVRHPMYTALFCQGIAQALLVTNWVAGPAMLVAFTVMFICRVRIEEQMMLTRFGLQYADYCNTTKRLLPGVY